MKKTLGRLAGAVLAGALISLAVAPVASADDTAPTSSEVASTTSEAPPVESTTSEAPPADSSTSDAPSTSDSPTGTAGPTDSSQPGEPSETGAPSDTGTPSDTGQPTEPTSPTTSGSEEPPPGEPEYVDDVAYGIDIDGGYGIFAIACAAGEPTNVRSDDFDFVEGPQQNETDGRYWEWLVKRHDGISFDAGNVTADWTCGGQPTDDHPVPPAGGAAAGSAGTTNGDGNSQVKYTPKGGIETGFGGMAA